MELKILGPAEMRNNNGELEHSFLAGPKRLALLVYLLLHKPQGFHRRDSLLPLFWHEQDQKSARNALSNMLYHIRNTLGKDTIENRGSEEIAINPELFWCDAVAFDKALNKKDYETAFNLYRADLLKGFHVYEASSELDQWMEQERKRFHNLVLEAGYTLAEKAFDRRNYKQAVAIAKKTSELDPFSEKIQLQLISFLYKSGEPQAALEAYALFSDLIYEEFGTEPGQKLKSLCKLIKEQEPVSSIPLASEKLLKESSSQASIAVLPFESIGFEKTSSFTDAIHSDILTRLSQVSDLFVISRTSVRNFKDTSKLLPEIARELQVEWVLTGEVQEIGKQVKVSVRLVNAPQDRQVWAEMYQRKLSAGEIFSIQSEITRNIIAALEMRLTSKEKKAIKQIPTEDLEAFRLHAHGKWNLDQRSEKAMRLAEDYFRAALARDPNYAQAWLGLADALSLLHDYGYEKDGTTILTEAENAANKALSIDPELAEAYASLGLLHTTHRDGNAAISNLKKAIALRPGYAEAYAWLSWILLLTGNKNGGLENAKKGVEWNPLSQEALGNLSLSLLALKEYEISLKEAKRLIQLQPDFTTAQFEAGLALYHLGRYEEAIELLKGLSVPWAGNGPLVTMILCYYKTAREAEAKKHLESIRNDRFGNGLIKLIEGNYEEAYALFLKIKRWNYWEMLSMHHFYPDLLDRVREDRHFKKILSVLNTNWGMNPETEPEPKESKQQGSVKSKNSFSQDTLHKNFSEKSITVLPFKDLNSEDPRFAFGIHSDILTSLSGIKDFQVISRASVNHYDTTGKTAAEVGKDFKTAWLLEGDVKQSTTEIKISVRLIKTSGSTLVWRDSFQDKLTIENIFLIQQHIISEILEILGVHTTEKEEKRVITRPTTNLNAYRLYTYGRNCLDQRTESDIYRGLDSFQACIELDPEYALAWSGLADALSLLDYYGYLGPKSSPTPLEAAKKAVALDPELGEARTSLGIAYSGHREGTAALKEMQLAVNLTPGYAEGLTWLGWINLMLGRPKAALEPARKAVRLSPLTPAIRIFLAEICLANGLHKEALAEARRGREINPEYGLAHYMEGLTLYHIGELKKATEAFEKTLTLVPDRGTPTKSEVRTALAFTAHASGDESPGLDLKNRIYKSIDPFPLGMLHVLHGELDEAFHIFNRVQNWSSFSVEILRYFFPDALSLLRKDRRYKELIAVINEAWGLPADTAFR